MPYVQVTQPLYRDEMIAIAMEELLLDLKVVNLETISIVALRKLKDEIRRRIRNVQVEYEEVYEGLD